MKQIHAGVVLVSKFVVAENSKFQKYIDYLDRETAIRNKHYGEFNAFEKSIEFEGYQDYMGNPEKSSGLFTEDLDFPDDNQKKQLKNAFETAQKNESIMWQSVLSFDNIWLEKNGLYNSETKELEEREIRRITREAVRKMVQYENISSTCKWCASIHFNTDNIHIHIAITEPIPTREKIYYNGRWQYRGKFKPSSLEYAKSTVVNNILNQNQDILKINEIIRNNILENKKENDIYTDKSLEEKLKKLHEVLPDNPKLWFYNKKEIAPFKPIIDDISKEYLKKYHNEDLKELQVILDKTEKIYKEAYGSGEKRNNNYTNNKMKDLYTRLGNAILTDMRNRDKEVKAEYFRHLKQGTIKGNRSFVKYRSNYNYNNGRLYSALRKTMNDDLLRHRKNLQAYEKLKEIQQSEEYQR